MSRLTPNQRARLIDSGYCPMHIVGRNGTCVPRARNHGGKIYGGATLSFMLERGWLKADGDRLEITQAGMLQLPAQTALSLQAVRRLALSLNISR